MIEAQGASINSGYCSGFTNAGKGALQVHGHPEGCSGTDQSFNVESGGKINITSGSICSGAFSGNSIPR